MPPASRELLLFLRFLKMKVYQGCLVDSLQNNSLEFIKDDGQECRHIEQFAYFTFAPPDNFVRRITGTVGTEKHFDDAFEIEAFVLLNIDVRPETASLHHIMALSLALNFKTS